MLIRLCAISVALALLIGCATPTATRGSDSASVAPITPVASVPAEVPEVIAEQEPEAPVATMPAPVAPTLTPAPAPTPAPAVEPTPAPEPAPAPVAKTTPPVARPADAAPKKAPVAIAKPRVPEQKAAESVAAEMQIIKGRLELTEGARQRVTPGEIAEGLVYFLPTAGAPLPKPGTFSISTQSKAFNPNYLVVPVGSTVSFPNSDTVLHHVYSRTPGSTFDLGTFGPGESRQAVLKKAGLVIVNCNVHSSMRANVLVLATPYYTRPGKDGSFQLKDVPVGSGTLVFWHPRSNAESLPFEAGRTTPVVKSLVATKAGLEAHSAAGH